MERLISHRRGRALAPPLLALALLATLVGGARAGYQATVDVNDTAFGQACLG
jgi:hypothetical protein